MRIRILLFTLIANPDPVFDFVTDPDPARHENDGNLRLVLYKAYRAPKVMRIQICYPVGYDLKTRALPHTVNPGQTLQREKQEKTKD
jgi:hypothetical protein